MCIKFFKELFKRNQKENSKKTKNRVKKVSKITKIIDINNIPPKIEKSYNPSLYIGNQHWKLFASLFNQSIKKIKIITGSISYTELSLLCAHINEGVEIKILTGRGRGYDKIFRMKNINRDNIKRCQRLHAKITIFDDNYMIIGSSNITKSSLGDHNGNYGNYEADVLIKDKEMIKSANLLFDILWNERTNIKLLENDSGFISSAYGIPFKLKELIIKAKKEITIIVPPFFQKSSFIKSIPRYIRDLNRNVKIKIIASHRILEKNLEGLEEIQELERTKLILVRNNIHCKIYVFDKKIAIISSLNLYFRSWIKNLETGVIIEDKTSIEKIKSFIHRLEKKETSIKVISLSEGTEKASIFEDYIEKLFFKFQTEGERLIPELLLDYNSITERNKKKLVPTLSNKHQKVIKDFTKSQPEITQILPEIFGLFELNQKQRTKLKNRRGKLFSKLDNLYIKINRLSESKNNLYHKANRHKFKRDRVQLKLKKFKKKRRKLKEEIKEIKEKLSRNNQNHDLMSLTEKLAEKENHLNKLWNIHWNLNEESKYHHKESISKFSEVNRLESLIKKLFIKVNQVKQNINKINIQIVRLKTNKDISEIEKKIIIKELFEYLMICPYTTEKEIIWYFVDFATDYEIYLDSNLLFETFHLAFQTKKPMKNAGFLFKLMKNISRIFELRFKKTAHSLFKNMILSRGRSGMEIINKEQFDNICKDLSKYFGLSAPKPEKILKAMIKHKQSLKRITKNDKYYSRICDIFKDNKSKEFRELKRLIKRNKKS